MELSKSYLLVSRYTGISVIVKNEMEKYSKNIPVPMLALYEYPVIRLVSKVTSVVTIYKTAIAIFCCAVKSDPDLSRMLITEFQCRIHCLLVLLVGSYSK
jgi:hypothetical protein